MRTAQRFFAYFLLGVLFYCSCIFCKLFLHPSNDRAWSADQARLAYIVFNDDDTVTIQDIRDFQYQSTDKYKARYKTETFDLNKLESAWLIVEPFGKFGAAHTMVSFGFADGRYLAISVEIRKERGEKFSPWKGLLRQYEIVYMVATEEDALMLRTNYRKDIVRLYPVKVSREKMRAVLVSMLKRANALREEPQFYNTLSNNCATNIAHHARKFSEKDIPWWDYRYLMPAYFDEVAYNLGIIDTTLSLEKAREHFNITQKAQKCPRTLFSKCIRERL